MSDFHCFRKRLSVFTNSLFCSIFLTSIVPQSAISAEADTASTNLASVRSAFHQAYGYGANARDFSQAKIVYVDKLTDSSPPLPGELRHAINRVSGPRIVLFRTGGSIELTRTLFINKEDSDLYIAGQSAPGDGILIKPANPLTAKDLIRLTNADNVMIRYLRLRAGKNRTPGSGDNISIIGSSNVVIDHVSMSWANDENLGMWADDSNQMRNVTIQNNLIAEPLGPRSTNFLVAVKPDFTRKSNVYRIENQQNISIHRNVFAHADQQAPMIAAKNALIANNLTYNWQKFAFGNIGSTEANYVGNFLIEGPASKGRKFNVYAHQSFTFKGSEPPVDRYDESDPKTYYLPSGAIFHDGNYRDYYSASVADGMFDEWSEYVERIGLANHFFQCDGSDWRCLTNNRSDKPLPDTSAQPYPVATAKSSLRTELLNNAGASSRLLCDGGWTDARDETDTRIITDIARKRAPQTTPSPQNENDVGGFDTFATGRACADSDNDGMPDEYERKYQLNEQAFDALNDNDRDGMLNIEEYLDGTNPLNSDDGGSSSGGSSSGGSSSGGSSSGSSSSGSSSSGSSSSGSSSSGSSSSGSSSSGSSSSGSSSSGSSSSGSSSSGSSSSGGSSGSSSSSSGPVDPSRRTKAFPGAFGYGANARNWRNAKIVEVTRLSDSQPSVKGELRYAINSVSGPRIIVFKTGGVINLKRTLLINEKDANVYIAGQTAPGGGITIKSTNSKSDLIRLNRTHDVILRYLRLRLGKGATPGTGDNLSNVGSSNVLIDHVSMSWANDENLGMWTYRDRPMQNITIQNNLLAEPLAPHATNFLINSERVFSNKANPYPAVDIIKNFSIHRNIFAHSTHRAPHTGSRNTLLANNLTFDWLYFSFGTVGKSQADYVNNFLVEGPSSNHAKFRVYAHQSFTFNEKDQPKNRYDPKDPKVYYLPLGSIYHSDNYRDYYNARSKDGFFDEWATYVERIGLSSRFYACDGSDWRCLQNNRRNEPLVDSSAQPYPIQAATNSLRQDLMSNAGSSARLNCAGAWVKNRDAIDIRVIREIGNKKASSPTTPSDVGGYASVDSGRPCADKDSDGMPDEFEAKYSLNRSRDDARLDPDGDGYTNFEEYLNGTNPNRAHGS